jgi:hypothetical protein
VTGVQTCALPISKPVDPKPRKSVAPVPEASSAPIIKNTPKADAQPFEWERLIDYVRKEYVALYSVLSKCKHELEHDTLTLYAGNAFYKKKLDDAKYSPQLYSALEAIGSFNLTIHTIPTAPPPKSSQAAAVADIMGGGEEVNVDADLSSAPAAA